MPPRASRGRPSGSCFGRAPQRRRIAGRGFAEHFGPERRVDRPAVAAKPRATPPRTRRAASTASTPVAFAASSPGCSPGRTSGSLAPLVQRLQEHRRPLRAAVDDRRSRAARRRRSDRRTGCSAGTAARRARSVVPCRIATPSPMRSITRARRAANSSGGKISAPVKTGCADSQATTASSAAAMVKIRIRMAIAAL